MRLFLDNNLSPRLRELLPEFDVIHLRDRLPPNAPDIDVLNLAHSENRTLISADTDFGGLLAFSGAVSPSVVLLRRRSGRSAEAVAALLSLNLPELSKDLAEGAIVVLAEDEVRIRRLPIRRG